MPYKVQHVSERLFDAAMQRRRTDALLLLSVYIPVLWYDATVRRICDTCLNYLDYGGWREVVAVVMSVMAIVTLWPLSLVVCGYDIAIQYIAQKCDFLD